MPDLISKNYLLRRGPLGTPCGEWLDLCKTGESRRRYTCAGGTSIGFGEFASSNPLSGVALRVRTVRGGSHANTLAVPDLEFLLWSVLPLVARSPVKEVGACLFPRAPKIRCPSHTWAERAIPFVGPGRVGKLFKIRHPAGGPTRKGKAPYTRSWLCPDHLWISWRHSLPGPPADPIPGHLPWFPPTSKCVLRRSELDHSVEPLAATRQSSLRA